MCPRSHNPCSSSWQHREKVSTFLSYLFLPPNLAAFTKNARFLFFLTCVWICCSDLLQVQPRLMYKAAFVFQVAAGLGSAEQRGAVPLFAEGLSRQASSDQGLQCTAPVPLDKGSHVCRVLFAVSCVLMSHWPEPRFSVRLSHTT